MKASDNDLSWAEDVPAPRDADGKLVPLDTEELVHKGKTREVYGFFYNIRYRDWFVEFGEYEYIRLGACAMHDSWKRLEEDARKAPRDYVEGRGIAAAKGGQVAAMAGDIVRRAKALAGVSDRD